MNQELSVKRDRSPSPPPPMSPFNSPKQRRTFLTLIMSNTRIIPPHLHIDRVQPEHPGVKRMGGLALMGEASKMHRVCNYLADSVPSAQASVKVGRGRTQWV